MKNTPKLLLFLLVTLMTSLCGFAQTEVKMVSHSDIDVQYTGEDNYIAYLNKRGLSKDDVYKDYYADKFTFDAGKIKSGAVKEIKVPFTNASDDHYIKITTVNEICDCLNAEFPEGATFKPGETKQGTLSFSTKGLSGKVRRAVEVRTYTNMKEINYLVWIQAEIN